MEKEQIFQVDELPVVLEGGESMVCLVTRVKIRKLSTLIWSIIAYFRMRRRVRDVRGLFEVSLVLKRRRTLFFISFWKDVAAMADFATAVGPLHPQAVRKMRSAGAEVWSGHFVLRGTAPHSRPWANVPVSLEKR
jgi:hypothetical protein